MAALGVIFDMDGVIVDNHHYHYKAWQAMFEKYRLDISELQYMENINGRTLPEILAYIFKKEITQDELSRYGNEKESLYRELYRSDIVPVKGLPEFLNALKAEDIPVAVGTSSTQENIDFTLELTALRKYFDRIIDGSMVTQGKPNPQVYLKAAKTLALPAEKCVVFEDALSGIEAAKRAGCKVIALATTHPREELTHADIVIDSFVSFSIDQMRQLFE